MAAAGVAMVVEGRNLANGIFLRLSILNRDNQGDGQVNRSTRATSHLAQAFQSADAVCRHFVIINHRCHR
jgi:hypothetical protein